MGVQACRLRAFQRLKCLKVFLARPIPQAQATPRPHQWLLMGVQACRLPGLKPLKPLQRCKIFLAAQPRRHKLPKATSIASYGCRIVFGICFYSFGFLFWVSCLVWFVWCFAGLSHGFCVKKLMIFHGICYILVLWFSFCVVSATFCYLFRPKTCEFSMVCASICYI